MYDGNLTPHSQTNTGTEPHPVHTPDNSVVAYDHTAPGPSNTVYDVAQVMAAEQATYDVINVLGGENYSVLNRRGREDQNPSEYNVLVHHSNKLSFPSQTEEYSKLEV